MVRVSSAVSSKQRKKKVLKQAKGQFGHRKKRFRQAVKSVKRGLVFQFRDRKVRKRAFRSLWIIRIGAACKEEGLGYNRFINGLNKAEINIDRKVLAELAINEPAAFKKLVEVAKAQLAKTSKQ